MVGEHKQPEHAYERIPALEEKQREELQAIVTEAKAKMGLCNEASSNLENMLSELQMQRDNARGLIEETFQTYRTFLEKRKVSAGLGVVGCWRVHSFEEMCGTEWVNNVHDTNI